jgi:hypothetical protein
MYDVHTVSHDTLDLVKHNKIKMRFVKEIKDNFQASTTHLKKISLSES